MPAYSHSCEAAATSLLEEFPDVDGTVDDEYGSAEADGQLLPSGADECSLGGHMDSRAESCSVQIYSGAYAAGAATSIVAECYRRESYSLALLSSSISDVDGGSELLASSMSEGESSVAAEAYSADSRLSE